MRILFDQGTPVPLRRCLSGHVVATTYELGWSTVANGDLIRLAEQEGYELLITTDTNLRYQQNLKKRNLAILELSTTSWPRIRQVTERVQAKIVFRLNSSASRSTSRKQARSSSRLASSEFTPGISSTHHMVDAQAGVLAG